jgi:hypothetical protein
MNHEQLGFNNSKGQPNDTETMQAAIRALITGVRVDAKRFSEERGNEFDERSVSHKLAQIVRAALEDKRDAIKMIDEYMALAGEV